MEAGCGEAVKGFHDHTKMLRLSPLGNVETKGNQVKSRYNGIA